MIFPSSCEKNFLLSLGLPGDNQNCTRRMGLKMKRSEDKQGVGDLEGNTGALEVAYYGRCSGKLWISQDIS